MDFIHAPTGDPHKFLRIPVPNRDVFQGVGAYLETLVRRITAPRLKTL